MSDKKINVLIVDDSTIIRQILKNTLSAYADINIIGTAANGIIALEKIKLLSPDIVVLDIEMPEMDGFTTLKNIVKDYPKVKVIMCSTLTEAGATATIDSLVIGAHDYIPKPTSTTAAGLLSLNNKQGFSQDLYNKIFALCGDKPKPEAAIQQKFREFANPLHYPLFEVVVIGISTGGPEALIKLIPQLPNDFPLPILIVQHMPPMFTRLLAERLQLKSTLKICEGSDKQTLQPGTVYIAPGDYHMEIERFSKGYMIQLNQAPAVNYSRPSVDILFQSAAKLCKEHVLGVVMTGMGQDGLAGSQKIREQGGIVFVQDQASSAVWGMPGAVANAQLANKIIALNELSQEIIKATAKNKMQANKVLTL